ncbi:MAG: hypothetical protein ACU83N_11800 [Gammaproteobacteria bacterium]
MSAETQKNIKLPGPMRFVWGSLGCYWLSGNGHAGFFGIALMLLSMIPVLMIEKNSPQKFEKFRSDRSV